MEGILKQIQKAVRNCIPEIGTSVTRAHTGRISESFTQEQQVCEVLVNEWLNGASDDPTHWGRRLVMEIIAELPRCAAPQAYRARLYDDTVDPRDPLQFGPSPFRPPNRYNRLGQSALYLAMNSDGLRAEMAPYKKAKQRLYFVRYLPVDSLSLVDLSDVTVHSAIHLAFDRAERLDHDYEAAQRLADVVRELGIDGIIVPGVRGSKEQHYRNIVIFNCLEWAMWVDSRHPPALLSI